MKEALGMRKNNVIFDERREVSDSVDVANGAKMVLLMTTQKWSSSWNLVDPVRRLQYW